MVKQYFVPTSVFGQVIEVDAAAGVGVAPSIEGDYRAIAGVLAAGTVTVAVDTIAPTLSGVSVSDTNTTATLSWSTDEGNGLAYWMVDTNATRTAAQVRAGVGVVSDTRSVTAAGAQTNITATGLTASTAYFFHIVHVDDAGNESAVSSTAFTTEAAAAAFWTQSATGPYFVDPVAPSAGTTRVRHSFKWRIPSSVPSVTGTRFVTTQEANGFDLGFITNGGATELLIAKVEDSAGLDVTPVSNSVWVGARDVWATIDIYADQVAQEVVFQINGGAAVVRPFKAVGNGSFQGSPREFSWFAGITGLQPLQEGVQFEFFETWFTVGGVETSRKRIAGDAATVNAQPWKAGGDAT